MSMYYLLYEIYYSIISFVTVYMSEVISHTVESSCFSYRQLRTLARWTVNKSFSTTKCPRNLNGQ